MKKAWSWREEPRPPCPSDRMDSIPDWAKRGRAGWKNTGQHRPPFALEPAPGQESVWDYPRPPRLDPDDREVTVHLGTDLIARTHAAYRVLETAGPPTFYLPAADVEAEFLEVRAGRSRCEWKGEAGYWSIVTSDQRIDDAAWSYEEPFPEFEAIRGYISFYPALLCCRVEGIPVQPQPGGFYAGWITPEIVGPFKGEPGSQDW
jgi:uncharacterized protein (DUF427 family)